MKHNNYIKIKGFVALGLFIVAGCADLDIENLNEPEAKEALATPADIAALSQGSFLRSG